MSRKTVPFALDIHGEVTRAAQERKSQGYRAIKMNASAELHYINTPTRLDQIVEIFCILPPPTPRSSASNQ